MPHDLSDGAGRPFAGRTALVTGASGGLGGAIARQLAREGADLALTYAGHREDADAVAADCQSAGARTLVTQADFTDHSAPTLLVDEVRAALGDVDVLVPAAGAGTKAMWHEVDQDLWDTTMTVNLRAPFRLAQALLPGMQQRGWGRILFISSIAALNGGVIGPHYAASKAALHGLTHSLAGAVAGSGVTVNSIAPALIGGTRMLPRDPDDPDKLPMPIPVGRLGEADEVADLAVAMLRNGYLTNKTITLDGGLYPS